MLVTEMRTSDGFICASQRCNSAYENWKQEKIPDWEDANKLF
jgi:hypothetical protein